MTIERVELIDSARKAFGANGLAPDAKIAWAKLTDMGWFMMTVPETLGGLGMGREAMGVIHYELGRALVPGPAIAQMVAIAALAHIHHEELLSRAMGGAVITTSLDLPGTGPLIRAVPDADRAEILIVDQVDRVRLVSLDQCTVAARASWDETRRLFDITLPSDDVGQVIAQGHSARAVSERMQSVRLFALAADALGGADAVLDMTVDYLKTRRQFDRPLAMFQSLKHRVADLKIALTLAQALLWSRAADECTTVQMGALKAHACAVYRDIAEEAIQLHGGIGLTQEYPCHLFFKRAMLNAALGGDRDHWEEIAGREALLALS
jgi:alkylation response protein AidB-like acyl-CoA dehydrogenase